MNILVIAPHTHLKYWQHLSSSFKDINSNSKVYGLTYIEDIDSYNQYFDKIFLIKQKEILAKKECNNSGLFEDIPNVNQVIARDRWLKNKKPNEALLILNNIYIELNKILNSNKIDLIIGEISCATNEIVFYLSLKLKIPFYNITPTPYKNRYFLYQATDIYGPRNYIKQQLKTIDFFSEVIEKGELKSEVIENLYSSIPQKVVKKKQFITVIRNILWIIKESILLKKKSLFSDQNNPIEINLLSATRIFGYNMRHFENNTFSLPKEYFLFFLHYEPDASTHTWAVNYKDQLLQIEQICNNLPNNVYLVVKEHPWSQLARSNKFYKSLKKLPSLILLHSSYNKLELIENAKGIITISGTVGYESWLLGKKIITFGNVFYDFFPDVYCGKNYDDLNKLLNSIRTNENCSTTLGKRIEVDNYVKNICTFEGSIFSYESEFENMSEEEKKRNMKLLIKHINNDLNR